MEDPVQLPPELVQLLVVIRFSTPLDDIVLDIPSPSTTAGAGLKQLIRAKLPSNLSTRRLRLIYSGRQLDDATPLSVSLRLRTLATNVAERQSDSDGYQEDEEDDFVNSRDKKGKEPVRNNAGAAAQPTPRRIKVYVHCSIGDVVLGDGDIVEEKSLAITSTQQQQQQQWVGGDTGSSTEGRYGAPVTTGSTSTVTEAPRGFDRLLSAGFTAEDVSGLRSQFLALQSLTHTPDPMPSGEELRRLEDRWMDEGSTRDGAPDPGTSGGGGFTNDGDGGGLGFGPGGLDDMVWGSVMGFFWPVGCALWLLREEGVWSWRKGLAVFAGVVTNFGFGVLQAMNLGGEFINRRYLVGVEALL